MIENSNIATVKYQADIETPTEYTGYVVDGNMSVPMEEGNRHYREVQEWIADGNTPEEAYTVEEILTTAKTKKLAEIDTAKNEAQLTPVTVRGVQFFGGREAGQKYDEALRLAQRMGLLVGNFLSADSGMIEVDEPYANEVVVAVAGATYMLWAKAQEYNAQVNMATTVAEVEAIIWTA